MKLSSLLMSAFTVLTITGCGGGSDTSTSTQQTPPPVQTTFSLSVGSGPESEVDENTEISWAMAYNGSTGDVNLSITVDDTTMSDEEYSISTSGNVVKMAIGDILSNGGSIGFTVHGTDANNAVGSQYIAVTVKNTSGDAKLNQISLYTSDLDNVLNVEQERAIIDKFTLLAVVNGNMSDEQRRTYIKGVDLLLDNTMGDTVRETINNSTIATDYTSGLTNETTLSTEMELFNTSLMEYVSSVNSMIIEVFATFAETENVPEFVLDGYSGSITFGTLSQWVGNPSIGTASSGDSAEAHWIFTEEFGFIENIILNDNTCSAE